MAQRSPRHSYVDSMSYQIEIGRYGDDADAREVAER